MARMTTTMPTAMPAIAPVPMPEWVVGLGSASTVEVGGLLWMATLLTGVPLTLVAGTLAAWLLLVRT